MVIGLLFICLVLAFFTPGPLFAQQIPPVGPTPGAGSDTRLYVYNPRMQEFAWIDANTVGPVPAPPASYGAAPQRLYAVNLPGRALAFNVRSWPRVAADTRVREIAHNTPVFVTDAVRGDDGEVWYRIGEEEYLNASGVRLPKGPPQLDS